jgi:hypothetical protein
MFPVYGGKCLSRKAVHNWVTNVSLMTRRLKRSCGDGWDNIEETSKLRVSTRWTARGQVYQCWWRIRQEINVFLFQVRISHVLRFISICDLFTDSPSYRRLNTHNCKCAFLGKWESVYLLLGAWRLKIGRQDVRGKMFTVRSTVLHKKLIVTKLFKNSMPLWTPNFINILTRAVASLNSEPV